MERAIAYIRVSDQRQVEDGGSLGTQEKQVASYVANQGYEFFRLFREEGESAKTDLRPRLQDMLMFCEDPANKVRVLVVPKIDRLARNAFDYTTLKLTLKKLGVRIESVGERIEDSPVGRFTESIMASVAQFDNEIRSERSKGGMVEAVAQGRWVWKAPKGYRNIRHDGKGTIEPHPVEAPLMQKAFAMLANGFQDPERVRIWLGQSGLKIARASFYSLIRNPVYIGQIHAFDGVSEGKPPFTPLISKKTFYEAHAAIAKRVGPRQWKRDREDFPLRGTIRCMCGTLMTAHQAEGRHAKYSYYRCMKCRNSNLRAEEVHKQFLIELGLYEMDPDLWQRFCRSVLRQDAEDRSNTLARQREGEKRIAELIELQKNLAVKNASGIIPDEIAKAQIAETSREVAEIKLNMPGFSVETHSEIVLRRLKEILCDIRLFWQHATLGTQKAFLHYMFPEGVAYTSENGFQTQDIQLLEQIKDELRRIVSGLVAHDVLFSSSVREWALGLYAAVADVEEVHEVVSGDPKRRKRPRQKRRNVV